jgi:hypothetical protein
MLERSFRLGLLALIAGLVVTGCRPSSGNPPPPGPVDAGQVDDGGTPAPPPEALSILSFPARAGLTGQAWTYRPLAAASTGGMVTWSLQSAPTGAELVGGTSIRWTPSETQSGAHDFVLKASAGELTAEQRFTVTVAELEVAASETVLPDSPLPVNLSVDAPLSPIRGSGMVIPPGALSGSAPLQLSVSAVENAPVPPSLALAGAAAGDVRVVDFGPSGLTFQQPVTVFVPVSDAALARGDLELQTFDFATSSWVGLPITSVDPVNKVVSAQVYHFSLYAAVPREPVFALEAGRGAAGSQCADAVIVRAPIVWNLPTLPAAEVNGYQGAATTLADVLTALKDGEQLQVATQLDVASADGTGSVREGVFAVARRLSSGKFTVTVATSAGPLPLSAAPELTLAELWPLLDGSRAQVRIPALAASGGASVSATTALSLLTAGSPAGVFPAGARPIGQQETLTVASLSALSDPDADCDGAPDAQDAEPNGPPPPSLVPSPSGTVRGRVGEAVQLSVGAPAGTTLEWSAAPAGLTVTPASGGGAASVVGDTPGVYQVKVRGTLSGAASEAGWQVVLDAPTAPNLPPRASILLPGGNVVRVGQPVILKAWGMDPEGAALKWAWSAQLPINATGDTVTFVPTAPGDVTVSLVANDGQLDSAAATVTVSVLPAEVNRPPGLPLVTPFSATVSRQNGVAQVSLFAQGTDPDGDAVQFRFLGSAQNPSGATLTSAGASATFEAFSDGAYEIKVTAIDSLGDEGPGAVVRILVAPPPPPVVVDADRDGYPEGMDCNDQSASVRPGAAELCGDGVDQDCDGKDLESVDCDLDRDGFTTRAGDCDDANPRRFPGLADRCDGMDNDCDGRVDQAFVVGSPCSVGVGACAATSTWVCNSTFTSVTCPATQGAPGAESCNGIDDDCNGKADDISGQAAGDISSCGGCGVACAAPANTAATCTAGGCGFTCNTGFVDVDKSPVNGCECELRGAEVCNGIDDNCNGLVDEGTGSAFYTGPAGTSGVGICQVGRVACVNGSPTVSPEKLPAPETCDGVDNDCNGRTDEAFDFANDPNHCGQCGKQCAAGESCRQGACTAPVTDAGFSCGTPLSECSGTFGPFCTNLASDFRNCGSCGKTCAAGQVCTAGTCAGGSTGTPDAGTPTDGGTSITCQAPSQACTGPAGQYCARVQSDVNNCGACGRVCPAGNTCSAGACVDLDECALGAARCSPKATCTNVPGSFICTCAAGYAGDGLTCLDVDECAAGTSLCSPDATCKNTEGSYACACESGFVGDGLSCGDIDECAVNPSPCDVNAGCFNTPGAFRCACNPGFTGTGQSGDCACPAGQLACSSADGLSSCVDTAVDPLHCGGCGKACPAGGACRNGSCVLPPATLNVTLGGSGVGVVKSTPAGINCGAACSASFPDGTSVTLTATAGSSSTFVGWGGDCATAGTQATCTVTASGIRTVEAMFRLEGGTDGGTSGGTDGGSSACPPGQVVCASTKGTFCADLAADSQNCGSCGNTCAAGSACINATCVAPQPPDGGTAGPDCPENTTPASPGGCSTATGGAVCIDTQWDSFNCGSCGNVCPQGQSCSNGNCRPDTGISCDPLTLPCNGLEGTICINPLDDVLNCGACGNVCANGFTCRQSTCVQASTQTLTVLRDGDGSGSVVSVPGGIDCGRACAWDFPEGTFVTLTARPDSNSIFAGWTGPCAGTGPCTVTLAGATTVTATFNSAFPTDGGAGCPPGQVTCSSPSGSVCADLGADRLNCGACGNACREDEACKNGSCTALGGSDGGAGASCPTGQVVCQSTVGPLCVDLGFDRLNCGACGSACKSSEICSNGTCTAGSGTDGGTSSNCPPGKSACQTATGLACVDLGFDRLNCGACGSACKTSEVCSNGTCTAGSGSDGGTSTQCPPGRSACQSEGGLLCVDLGFDRLNCGACGNACQGDSFCQGGTCMAGSGGGDGGTGGNSAMLGVTRSGTGGGFISSLPQGISCGSTCTAPFPDGTQVTLTAQPDSLSTFGGWTGACTGTGPSCSVLVSNLQSTFVEAIFNASTTGGGGNNACPQNTVPASPAGCATSTRGAVCIDTLWDTFNCGSCGNTCAQGTTCNTGSCGPPAGITCDPSALPCHGPRGPLCVGPSSDILNCGACGNVCASGYVCQQAACVVASSQSVSLNVLKGGGGIGYVSSAPAGIACGDKCMASFPAGETVTLTAVADTNSTFAGWAGPCEGSGSVCTLSLTAATTVTAHFDLVGGGDGGTSSNCPPGKSACQTTTGLACVDLGVDRLNCGACGNACQGDSFCQGGTCVVGSSGGDGGFVQDGGTSSNCPPGKSACQTATGLACVDLGFDRLNCGACGNACQGDSFCQGGTCVVGSSGGDGGFVQDGGTSSNCPPGKSACQTTTGLACVDLGFDRLNCGACGNACPADAYCQNATCVPSTGGGDGGFVQDGGTGDVTCPQGTTPSGGTCTTATGGAVCIDTAWDDFNCGTCGTQCPGGTSCNNKTCAVSSGLSCQGGLIPCNGPSGPSCVNPSNDSRNCGACGNVCAVGRACQNSACVPAYVLNVVKNGTGAGHVSSVPLGIDCGGICSGSFPSGALVRLTAAPDVRSSFAGWMGPCSSSTDPNSCTVSITSAVSVTATFNAN